MDDKQPARQDYGLETVQASATEDTTPGTLTLQHIDGRPVLTLSDGTGAPAHTTVLDATGNIIGTYTAGPPRRESRMREIVHLTTGSTPLPQRDSTRNP